MRRTLGIALIFLTLASGFTLPAAAATCTKHGTSSSDFISGTRGRDVICARGAGDFAAGEEGRDLVRGGPANDTLVAGRGADRLLGRGGNDKLFAVDGHSRDVLFGGPGFDQCYGEKHDRYRSCETRHTNRSPTYPLAVVMGLIRAFERTVAVANHQICLLDKLLCITTKG